MDTSQPLPGRLSGTEGMSQAPRAPAVTLVIFGAGGDLTKRLLMPSLYNLRLGGLLDDAFEVIAVDHNDVDEEAYRTGLTEAMHGFVSHRGGSSSRRG